MPQEDWRNGWGSMFFVPEHHQMPDGYLPAPLTFLAALAARTQRAELGTGIMQLPLFHPLQIAEQGAVIDNLSKGRFILGAGLGLIEKEFAAFEIPLSEAASRFTESVEILKRAWAGETFSHQGRHFQFTDVTITPRPVRRPRPPIWVGAMSDITLKRAGRIGDGRISDPLHNFDVMKSWSAIYRGQRQKQGIHGLKLHSCVMPGWERVAPKWSGSGGRISRRIICSTCILGSLRLGVSMRIGNRGCGRSNQIMSGPSRACAPNRLICGTPDEVVADIKRYEREIGCQYMILMLRHPTGPSHQETLQCIELLGSKVLPQCR